MEAFFDIFEEVVAKERGQIVDRKQADDMAYASAWMPYEGRIKRGDQLKGGWALLSQNQEVQVWSFHLRMLCLNGAVRVLPQKHVTFFEQEEAAFRLHLTTYLSDQVQEEVDFQARMYRKAQQIWLPPSIRFHLKLKLAKIMRQFIRQYPQHQKEIRHLRTIDQAETLFDLINHITATAREVQHAKMKWELMKLGGDLLQNGPAVLYPDALKPDHLKEGEAWNRGYTLKSRHTRTMGYSFREEQEMIV
ncbi:MAG: hypothetical protein AAF135_06225 [Bacteroidota bacterium]